MTSQKPVNRRIGEPEYRGTGAPTHPLTVSPSHSASVPRLAGSPTPRFLLLAAVLLSLFSLAVTHCRAAHVTFTFQNAAALGQTNRPFFLYPIGAPFTNGAGAIITRDRVTTNSSAGSVTISNIYGWTYRSELQGIYGTTTNYYNFPLTNGVILAADFATGVLTNSAGLISYSQSASDTRFVNSAGDTMTGGLTNTVRIVSGGPFYASASSSYLGTNVWIGDLLLTWGADAIGGPSGGLYLTDTDGDSIPHQILTDATGGSQTNILLANVLNAGTAAYSNSAAFQPASATLSNATSLATSNANSVIASSQGKGTNVNFYTPTTNSWVTVTNNGQNLVVQLLPGTNITVVQFGYDSGHFARLTWNPYHGSKPELEVTTTANVSYNAGYDSQGDAVQQHGSSFASHERLFSQYDKPSSDISAASPLGYSKPWSYVTWYWNGSGAAYAAPTIQSFSTSNNLFGLKLTAGRSGDIPLFSGSAWDVGPSWLELRSDNVATFSGNVQYSTNSGAALTPDFSKPYTLLQTNAAFTFLTPVGVSMTNAQTTVTLITNSTAVAVAITAPANVYTNGTWNCTNLTTITWFNYGGRFTNAIAFPIR